MVVPWIWYRIWKFWVIYILVFLVFQVFSTAELISLAKTVNLAVWTFSLIFFAWFHIVWHRCASNSNATLNWFLVLEKLGRQVKFIVLKHILEIKTIYRGELWRYQKSGAWAPELWCPRFFWRAPEVWCPSKITTDFLFLFQDWASEQWISLVCQLYCCVLYETWLYQNMLSLNGLLHSNKNLNFPRLFARLTPVFLFKKHPSFARLFSNIGPSEELGTLHIQKLFFLGQV